MIVRVDPQANAVYLALDERPGQVAQTHVCDVFFRGGSVHLDVDDDNRLRGIEILGMTNVLSDDAIRALEQAGGGLLR
jgi:uncharacterized protein YuzE